METPPEKQSRLPSKRFVALLYIPLMVPAIVPIYMASDQDDPVLVAIMIGTAVAVLIANALFLILIYRWFARGSKQ